MTEHKDTITAAETMAANREAMRQVYVFFGGLAVVAVLIVGGIIGGLVLAFGGNGPSPAEQEAEQIMAQCYTVVQPVNYPRVSTAEEQEIRACAYAATDDPEVIAHLNEVLPDGK